MKIQKASPKLRLFGISCRKLCVSLLLSLLFVLPSLLPVYAQDRAIVHVVVAGDTLSSIARRYNVTVADLMARNNIRNADMIRPGQRIVIPVVVRPTPTRTPTPAVQPSRTPTHNTASPTRRVTATPTPTIRAPQPGTFYTVRSGDTLSGIARLYGVTVEAIMERNGLTSTVLTVGRLLIIPLPADSATSTPTPTPTSVGSPGQPNGGLLPGPSEEDLVPTNTPEPTSTSFVTETPEPVVP